MLHFYWHGNVCTTGDYRSAVMQLSHILFPLFITQWYLFIHKISVGTLHSIWNFFIQDIIVASIIHLL